MCFFFIVIWMKRKERENVERITKDQIKALDYTVQLVHLPRHKDVRKLREEVCVRLLGVWRANLSLFCSPDVCCSRRSERTSRRC